MTQTAATRDPFYRILGVAAALVATIAWGVPTLSSSVGEVAAAAPAVVASVATAR